MDTKTFLRYILWEIYLFLIGIIILVIFIIYLIFFIPSLILRPIMQYSKRYFRPDLADILPMMGSALAQSDDPDYTMTAIVAQVTFNGILDYKKSIKSFENKVIQCKLPNGELRYPELQQSITEWMGYKFWKWEDDFDVLDHFTFRKDLKSTPEGIYQLGQELLCKSFNPLKSPWDFTLIPGVEKDTTVVFLRIHHSLADGYSLLFLFQRFFGSDDIDDAIAGNLKPATFPSSQIKAKYSSINVKYCITFPFKVLRLFGELAHNTASSFLWKIPQDKKSKDYCFNIGKTIEAKDIIKIKNAVGVSFTSVVFSLLVGGMNRFIRQKSEKLPESLPCIITVPIEGHPDKLVNKFSFAMASFPVGESDSLKRLKLLHDNFEDLRNSPVPLIGYLVLMLHGSHFNFIGKIINSYKYAPFLTSYFPLGNENWAIDGKNVIELSFYLRLHQGELGGAFCISSFKGGIKITPAFNAALFNKDEINELSHQIDNEVKELLKAIW